MKKIIYLLILLTIILNIKINTYANQTSFYEAEKLNNIYINKYNVQTKQIWFQRSQMIKETNTNEIAYCIDPFIYFKNNSIYTESNINLNNEKLNKIKLLAHYGYKYENHNDEIWYAVTQVAIWREIIGDNNVYFTNKLNGQRINNYEYLINELYETINNNMKKPSFENKEYTILENDTLILTDENNVLNKYNTNIGKIENNTLIINNLSKGNHKINLIKKDNKHNKPVLFYISQNSQSVMKTGDIIENNAVLQINSINTFLNIKKIDKDTKQCNNKLQGTKYQLFDQNNTKVKEVVIDNNCLAQIKNIPFGNYKLKEVKAGFGYQLDNKEYEVEINPTNNIINLTLENEIIKKKLIINKKYGNKINLNPEANIGFNIYNEDNQLINTIKTNNLGIAEIVLPFGKYIIKQINTTEGYEKAKDFEIIVENTNEEYKNLIDYKIEVPNTYNEQTNIYYKKNDSTSFIIILFIFLYLLNLKFKLIQKAI